MSEEARLEEAKQLLLSGVEVSEVAARLNLDNLKVAGIKGVLVRQGKLEGKVNQKVDHKVDHEVNLSTDEDLLRTVLGLAKVAKKDVEAVIEIADSYGIDAEGISEALKEQGVKKSAQKRVLSLWRAKAEEALSPELEEELGLGPRRDSRKPKDLPRNATELAEFLDKRDREREDKNRLARLEEKLNKLLEGGGAGSNPEAKEQMRELKGEVASLREALTDQRMGALEGKISELQNRKSGPEEMAAAAQTFVQALGESNLGKSISRVASAVSQDALISAYPGLKLEEPPTQEAAPSEKRQNLIDRLRGEGFVTTLREAEE